MTEKHFDLTQNQLKIVACISMLLDHIGAEIYPFAEWLRIVGRLALPLFAYFIWEGSIYTRNKLKYLARIFALGMICVGAYYVFAREIYGNILITFTLSLLILYPFGEWIKAVKEKQTWKSVGYFCLFAVMVFFAFVMCDVFYIDYGIYGVILPLFCQIGREVSLCIKNGNRTVQRIVILCVYCVGLLLLAFDKKGTQYYSLFALPLLALYSGDRGKHKMKYFFYLFYPLHLLLVGVVGMIVK